MPPKTPSTAPKLRGREPPKKDMNLIYSVLENITARDTNNKGLLKFDAAKAAQTANISSAEVLRNRWYRFRRTFLLNSKLPVDPKRARVSSIEPELRSLKPTASDLNLMFSILENLKDKVLADWAKVAERAGLGSADEAQQAWVNLCAEYRLFNDDVAVWRVSNSPCPQHPRVVIADKLQPAFISVADSISVPNTHKNPIAPFTPIRPTVLNVPSSNNLLPTPASVLTLAPANTRTVTGPHSPIHHQVFTLGTQIDNNNNNSIKNRPVTYASTDTQTYAKCCPTKAFGFKIVARALLWRSILAEESEREQHERVLGLSAGCRSHARYSWSWDTPINENEPVVNGDPTTTTVTSTSEGTDCKDRDTGTQTEDPCCRVTEFGFRVAFVYMFVKLDAPDQEEESVSGWPLDHLGAEAEPALNSNSSSSSSSYSYFFKSNSIFSHNHGITPATPITTGLTGTPFSPTTKRAKTLLAAARYIWSLSAKAEYEHDESLGEWPGWLLLDQGGGGVSLTAYGNALAAAVAPLRLLWLRVAVMI